LGVSGKNAIFFLKRMIKKKNALLPSLVNVKIKKMGIANLNYQKRICFTPGGGGHI
jgi:hypothetical protein